MLYVNIDLSELTELLNLDEGIKKVAADAARDLAAMTQAKIIELANEKLHSRRQMFVENLHMKEEEDGVFVISLAAKVRWIDDGMPAHNMLDALLSSRKAKHAKDGSRYLIIPFDHSPGLGPTKTTPPQQDLITAIKGEMRQRGIPFGKIEKDAAGEAKLGKLHSFTLGDRPIKTKDGPGMGRGNKGDVRQGPTGIPFLENVIVRQDKTKTGKIKRSISTFRVASSKHTGADRWNHPGTAAINMMEDAMKWATDTWEKDIAPAVINKILMEVS